MFQFSVKSIIRCTDGWDNTQANKYLSDLYKKQLTSTSSPMMTFDDLEKFFAYLNNNEKEDLLIFLKSFLPIWLLRY